MYFLKMYIESYTTSRCMCMYVYIYTRMYVYIYMYINYAYMHMSTCLCFCIFPPYLSTYTLTYLLLKICTVYFSVFVLLFHQPPAVCRVENQFCFRLINALLPRATMVLTVCGATGMSGPIVCLPDPRWVFLQRESLMRPVT